MKIPNKLLREWEQLRSGGDAQKIAELAGVSVMTVYRAFREEACNDDVLDAIAKYYKDKKDKVDAILQDYQD
jgi:AcrR family transcriptional regulator